MVKLFPEKSCFCCSLTTGLNFFLTITLLLRVAGVACGCFYGPYLYLVVTIGGLYILGRVLYFYILEWRDLIHLIFAGDFLLLWSLNKRTKEGKFLCDFTSQKVWIILWQILNVFGILGLVVAMDRLNKSLR